MVNESNSTQEKNPETLPESSEIPTQLHQLSQELTNMITMAEHSRELFKDTHEQNEEQLEGFKQELEAQLNKINEALNELRQVMTEAGAERWRIASERALQEGELHAKILKELVQEFYEQSEKTFGRMESVTVEIEKRIAKLLTTLSVEQNEVLDGLKQRTQSAYSEIDTMAASTLQSFRKSIRWLRLERILIAVASAFLAALITGMYLNAEWPWESYYRTSQERQVGQTVLRNWSKLLEAQKVEINRALDLQLRD